MEKDIEYILHNWDKYNLPLFYSNVTSKKVEEDIYEKYVSIDYYNTDQYPVQILIKPLTKVISSI